MARAAAGPRRVSDDLQLLLERSRERPVTIEELELTLRGRGIAMVLILMATPFVLPLPLPFLSTPFGVVIGILGIRLAFGLGHWLPRRIRARALDHATMGRLVRAAEWIARPLERIVRPRYTMLFSAGLGRSAGVAITAAAAIMSLPLPFPGANALPAFAIVLLAAAVMERDGLVLLAGYVMLFAAFAYLYFWWDLVAKVLARLAP